MTASGAWSVAPAAGDDPGASDPPAAEPAAPETEGPDPADASPFREALRTFLADGRYLFTFPRRPTRKGLILTASVVAGTVLLIGRDEEIRGQVVEHDSEDLDRLANRIEPLGREWVAGAALGTAWLVARAARREHAASTAGVAFEALAWTTLTTSAVKGAFARKRPADGVGEDEFWEGDTIFPSGHTSRSFAVAAVFADRYGRKGAWIGYPLAALIGLATVREDTHWASDILAGAGLGLAIGKGIAWRHPRDRSGGVAGSSQGAARPEAGGRTVRTPSGRAVQVELVPGAPATLRLRF